MKLRHYLLSLFSIYILLISWSACEVVTSPPPLSTIEGTDQTQEKEPLCDCETINQKGEDGVLLYKICKYIIDNDRVSEPANPCTWSILKKTEDILDGKKVIRVKLDCCYLGDQIIIDKKTQEVLRYKPGAK